MKSHLFVLLHLFLHMKITDIVVKQMKNYYFCECFKPAYFLNLLAEQMQL